MDPEPQLTVADPYPKTIRVRFLDFGNTILPTSQLPQTFLIPDPDPQPTLGRVADPDPETIRVRFLAPGSRILVRLLVTGRRIPAISCIRVPDRDQFDC